MRGPAEEEEVEEEELTLFQLAWETMEVARIVLERQEGTAPALRLSDVHYDLGEYQLETGDFKGAQAEFEQCLALRQKHCGPNDRLLAEAHYSLGLAHDNGDQFEASVRSHAAAAAILKANLAQMAAGPDAESLREVLREVESKVADAKEQLAAKARAAAAAGPAQPPAAAGVTTEGFGASAGPAAPTEISGLVRKSAAPAVVDVSALVKKRPAPQPEGDSKRAK